MSSQPMELPDANQLLLTGGKAPEGADFGSNPPSTVAGKILNGPTTYHAREFDRNNPGQGALRRWPDGNPVYGVYLDLETTQGARRLYVEKLRMTTAIQQAMLKAGVRSLAAGGYLSVTWTGTEASQGGGGMPANTYSAEYASPGAMPPANTWLTGGGVTIPAAQQPAPTHPGYPTTTPAAPLHPAYTPPPAQPQPAPAVPAPSQPVLTETIAAAMRNAGISTDGYVVVPG